MTRLCLFLLLLLAIPQSSRSDDDVPRILFLTQSKGFVHGSVKRKEATRSPAELAMMQLAKDSGEFTVVCSQNAEADITQENLEKYDIVALYTSGDLPVSDKRMRYFLEDWLTKKGRGVLGFHSATDTFKNYEPYWDFSGGTFNAHPWTSNTKVAIKVHDPSHPGMKPFGEQFEFTEEIYQYDHWQPEKVRVLMSLDMENTELKRPYHVPVAWCKQVGQGKYFYNNLGHREDTWKNKMFLDSVVGAVRWIAGKEEGEATPNPKTSAQQQADSKKYAEAATTN